MNAYRVTLRPASLIVGGRRFYKGFETLVAADHPDFEMFRRNKCFEMKAVEVSDGQAVRTGAKEKPAPASEKKLGLDGLDLDEATLKALNDNGITDMVSLLAYDTVEKLTALNGVGPKRAEQILKAIGKT